jgi:hypothetical protein
MSLEANNYSLVFKIFEESELVSGSEYVTGYELPVLSHLLDSWFISAISLFCVRDG